ncbi:MAG TPA: bifunctional precorrin-2 dehydrogenase/sirohydrochlorin ferrochelatase [Desulfopila sp.]|nr:bifunctional precorrin-2 dehydrogenase/sirohydrochlorin ferrochelatase [Desulfopila sp.]
MKLYPVNLNIEGKSCLIVGGGEVAARKIASLLSCGATVRVVSPECGPKIKTLAKNGVVQWLRRTYRSSDLDGAFLVFAATDNAEVQRLIVDEAKAKNILVNSADDPVSCTFQVPAKVRRGNLLLTVSTGGGSPALAAKLRRQLENAYGLEYQLLVDLLGRIRREIVADGKTQASHKAVFEKLLQLNLLQSIRQGDWPKLQEELGVVLPKDIDIDALIDSMQIEDTIDSLEADGSGFPLSSKKNGES